MTEVLKRRQIPEGVRDLLPDLAGQKRKLEEFIQQVFSRWGYREVSTPAFEYSEIFAADLKAGLENSIYRFPDEQGRMLVLRPDFTLPIARVVAVHFAEGPLPLRLCYGGEIFRYAGGLQGKQRALTQAGVELMGDATPGSDAEVVALAAAVLQEAGLDEFTLCLGHVGFLDLLLAAYDLLPQDVEKIKLLFNKKDFVTLKEMVTKLKISEQAKESIMQIPLLRGGVEVLTKARALLPAGANVQPLELLQEIWSVLEDYKVTQFVTLDLGMVRMMNYYTGMVFEGYTNGLGYPLCGGGRYDQLLTNFGCELSAVGFAVSLDHLLTVLTRQKKLPELLEPLFVAFDESGRENAIATAQTLRRQGAVVIVDLKAATYEEAFQAGCRLGATRLLYCTDNDIFDADLDRGQV
ncbi:MAG: ATP phosphoribosyltransferase regulatory subunit [Firmicutes bacterium]|nr:ATP phosphoribosyltransferase regulatory subunit [Bacillota bacterium]